MGTGGQIPIESNVQGFVLRLYGVHRWREVNGYSVAEDDERDVAMPGKVFVWRQPAAAAKVGGIERKIMGRPPIEFGSVPQRLFVEGIEEDQPLYLIGIFGLIPADKQPAEGMAYEHIGRPDGGEGEELVESREVNRP